MTEDVSYLHLLEDWVREVAWSGVEFEDPRIKYVTVQIDRDLWQELQGWLRDQSDD